MKRSMKLIKGLPFLTHSILLYDEKNLSLENLIKLELVLLIFNIVNNKIKNHFDISYLGDNHRYNTRQTNCIELRDLN